MKKILLLVLGFYFSLFTLLVALSSSKCCAQTWKPFPAQGGGLINEIIFDPSDSSTVYAASSESGLFKSTDAGNNWENVFSPQTFFSAYNFYCRDAAINQQNHNELFAVTGAAPWTDTAKGNLFHTTDGGTTWTKLNSPTSVSSTSAFCNAGHILLFNPNNAQQIFLGGQPQFNYNSGTAYYNSSGLWLSNDDGATWNSVADSLKTFWFTQLMFEPANNSILYFSVRDVVINNAHSGGSGLYKYNIASGSITKIFNQDVKEFAFDAGNPQIILVNGTGHLNISTDGGATWSVNISPLYNWNDYFIAAHPTEGGHWFIGGHSGNYFDIVETIDYGALWREAEFKHNPNKQLLEFNDATCDYEPEFGYGISGLNFSPLNPKLVFMNDDHALWKSYDADTILCHTTTANTSSNWKWKYSGHGIQNLDGRRLVMNNANGKIFFATHDPALFVSNDFGNSCSYVQLPDAYCTQVSAIAFSKSNPLTGYLGGSYYYNSDGKFFKTTDGGTSWTQLAYNYFDRDSNDIQNVTQIAISAFSPDTIVIGADIRYSQVPVHISYDGGNTWHKWAQGLNGSNFFSIWNHQQKLFTDNSGYFFIVHDNHLYRRTVADTAWYEIANAGGTGWWFSEAKPDVTVSGKIYVSYYNNYIFSSTDHGDTWASSITDVDCISLMDVSSAGIIAVAQCADAANNVGQKIFVSFDDGLNFIELPLTGIHGEINSINFIGGYELAGLSENTGAFLFDLNQVGIHETENSIANISISPNPASNQFQVLGFRFQTGDELEIYDLSGRKLREYFPTENTINTDLQSGIYFVRIKNSSRNMTLKLVIEQ